MCGVTSAEVWLFEDTFRRRVQYCNDGTVELRVDVSPDGAVVSVWQTVARGKSLGEVGRAISGQAQRGDAFDIDLQVKLVKDGLFGDDDTVIDGDIAIDRITEAFATLRAQLAGVRETLTAIARCEGRFSRDPLTHASNTIEDMAKLATDALAALDGAA